MAIQVGTHYVSEAAYAYAQSAASPSQTNQDILGALSAKFPNARFSTNTQPFQGSGTNNIAISPMILQQMASSPEKRLEYEALIYDCNMIQQSFGNALSGGSKVASQGFIIDAQGNLSSWCVTRSSADTDKKLWVPLPKNDKKGWLEKMNESLRQAWAPSTNRAEWRA